jgi:hypothetical protein
MKKQLTGTFSKYVGGKLIELTGVLNWIEN